MPDDPVFIWFPGQGVQYPRMGKALVSAWPPARDLFDAASDALGFDLAALMWESSGDELALTQNAQPAIVADSVAHFMWWKSVVAPDTPIAWATGHSIGAVSAAVACGLLDFSEGVRLARLRGELMAAAPGVGGMLAVATTSDRGRAWCEQVASEFDVDVAAYNGPRQVVLSGPKNQLLAAQKKLGGRSIMLNVSHGFHSRLMEPMLAAWQTALGQTPFSPARIDYLGSTTGLRTTDLAEVVRDLSEAFCSPVRWDCVLQHCGQDSHGVIAGPGKSLAKLWRHRPAGVILTLADEGQCEVV